MKKVFSSHPILRYCERHDLSQSDFADFVDLARSYVNDIIRRRSDCGGKAAHAIHRATKGEIDAFELLDWNFHHPKIAKVKRVKQRRSGSPPPDPEPQSMAAAGTPA